MNQFSKIILILLLFSSCQEEYIGCIKNYTFDHEIFKTKEDIFWYIGNIYNYIPDKKDYWQLPEETNTKKMGDCEDWVILAMQLLNDINLDPELVVVWMPNNTQHAILRIGNQYYESWGRDVNKSIESYYEIKEIYTYCETIWLTKNKK